ncbi:hypothetical protein ABES02_19045 [Neobacillus pocheonensis]|uniref:hypothetical protein n=1 Tax=Neobacillus pocheonensis TaxID=363869 RepID=UPI003D28723C
MLSNHSFKIFKKIHLFIGLSTSFLLTGVSIIGFIVRHPNLFKIDENVSSLNSGHFIFGNQEFDLCILLDILAISLLLLTISGFVMWYYPISVKKRKKKIHNIAA